MMGILKALFSRRRPGTFGKLIGVAAMAAMAPLAFFSTSHAEDSAWVSLLNGKDLRDWTLSFQKTGLKNTDSIFKILANGNLMVDIQTSFKTTGFGHLFYTKRKFSHYLVRSWYRFPTATYGPDWGFGWNMQNNGLMLHSQDPKTMKDKDFPTCIEVQLMGPKNLQNEGLKGLGFKYATSANLCTPSTFVAYNGNNNYTEHCTAAQYPDAWKNTEIPWDDKDGWSDATVRVLGDSLVQHFIHSIKVFEYSKIREDNGTPLKEGYISVQAEGTSTEFKTLEVLDLVGCMDKNKPGYRSYFVKDDASACNVSSVAVPQEAARFEWVREGGRFRVIGNGARIASVRKLDGSILERLSGADAPVTIYSPREPGMYLVTVETPSGAATRMVPFF
ncbi:MAG: DUF1080 domain-containing protein [Fibrobacterota bacterium]|nr:DUF1080 domain-containing protein [Fibrobacterota bacterium]